MKAPVLGLLLLPLACGGGSDSDSGSEPPALPVPRTVDKGDGCIVVITRDGTGPVARIGDEVALTYVARVRDTEPSGADPADPPAEQDADPSAGEAVDPAIPSAIPAPVPPSPAPPFASTEGWDAPLRIRLGDPGVLPGLARGIEGLAAGSAARIEIPPELGYGAEGNPSAGVPASATLLFEVEIRGVRR